jgi:hypothetical protein
VIKINNFEKQPNESYTISIDFTNILQENESIQACYITAYLNNDNVTSSVIVDISDDESEVYGSSDTSKVYIKVKDGISGLDYKITALIDTDDSNTYEEDILMLVREI